MADEVKAEPSLWDGLGLRGNQSGTLEVDNVTMPESRLVGPVGDGANSNDETVDPFFLLCSSACWNGISLGMIDIARRHTTARRHADVGMRVADYPTIQDYVGEAVIDTNASRSFVYLMARAMDDVTNRCDWSIHRDLLLHAQGGRAALDVAGKVHRGEERGKRLRQDAPCLRRDGVQTRPWD